MSRHILARAKFLLPISDKFGRTTRIQDGYILTEDDKIIETGQYSDDIGQRILERYNNSLIIIGAKPGSKEIPMLKGILMPSFTKAHGHDHESPIIGVAKDEPLTPWLDKAVNLFTGFMNNNRSGLESHFNKSPNLIAYMKARLDDIHYGITASMVHHCNHNKYRVGDIVQANSMANTKMIVGIGGQDRNYARDLLDIPSDIAVKRLDENYKAFKNVKHLRIIPGPDQFFSNGPEMLKALKKWAREHDTFLHIHSSEEPNTTSWFRKEYGMSEIEYANSLDILDENTIVAHQVNCIEHDLELLRDTGTHVVHNPLANTILGSGMPPVIKMMEMGIHVVISTDGSGSADNQNIIAAARLASQYQKALHQDATLLPAQKVLELITIEPAQMLKFNNGSLEPGKDADFIILDLNKPNMVPTRLDNVVENIIWAADGSEVQYVVSLGKIMKDNYIVVGLDAERILNEVQELSEMFIDYAKTATVVLETGAQGKS